MAQKPSFSKVYKSLGFRYLWINQVLMQLAINTVNFALIIWVYKLTDSNFAVSALLLAVYLPAFFFGLFAGVFVDRTDKRKLIILVDILLAVAFFIFPFIRSSYPLILLNTFFINTITQFFIPAEGSSIPMVVKKGELFIANSLFTFTLYGAFMIGFTIAGPILNNFSISPIFYLSSVLLLFAAFLSQKLPPLGKSRGNGTRIMDVISQEMKETFQFIRGRVPVATAIALLALLQGVIGIMAVLVPSYMERVLKIHATDASLFVMLPLGLGMIIGALIIGKFFHATPRRIMIIPAIILAGLLLIGVGVAPDIATLLNETEIPKRIHHLRYFFNAPSLSSTFAIGAFLLGLAAVTIIIPSQTILQESTTERNRGKILAVLAVLMNAVAAVPVILAGAFADFFGVQPIFIFVGSFIFIIGLLGTKPGMLLIAGFLPLRVKQFLGLNVTQTNLNKL
jgi:MFS family permease